MSGAFDSEVFYRSISQSLETIVGSTESVYLGMGEVYSSLIKELDAEFDRKESGSTDERALEESTDAAWTLIQENERAATLSLQTRVELLQSLESQLAAMVRLDQGIERIREDSLRMELMSLNALVVSVKAGESGRAFSCITSELKNLSNQTLELSDRIETKKKRLNETFAEFRELLDGMNRFENEISKAFIEPIHEVFESLKNQSTELVRGMNAIRSNSNSVKDPLVRIVVEMQNQDRIRQSTDHVLLSLEELKQSTFGQSMEDQLNHWSYLELLPDLSAQVLEEIAQEIYKNQESFRGSLEQAKSLIEQIEVERKSFIERNLDRTKEDIRTQRGEQGRELFETYLVQTQILFQKRESTLRKSLHLQEHIESLVESLQNLEDLVSQFKNIEVASRIQVARQKALAQMTENTEEMRSLTRQIEHDVSQTIGSTRVFVQEFDSNFAEYRRHCSDFLEIDTRFKQELKKRFEVIDTAKDKIARRIRSSQVFTDRFMEQFARTQKDLDDLTALLQKIEDQKTALQNVKLSISKEREHSMEAFHVSSWQLDQNKLKSMISRFTIFAHKKIAAELGRFDVESSVDSGEVTLF